MVYTFFLRAGNRFMFNQNLFNALISSNLDVKSELAII